MSVRDAAEALVARATALGHKGRVFTSEERQSVAAELPIYPTWLLDLLSDFPLCGLELGWQASAPTPDWDGVVWIEVSDARNIVAESRDFYPGVGILPAGYINFGGSSGSGDPYFLCVHDGDDPPIFQVYHDVGVDAATILREGRQQVAPSLSEFFRVAVLQGERS
ncbi:MAG: hypothetical protein U0804_12800 [Gemmataceae bacterium]